ncbi:porin [Roseateles saccharophilus]|uniref:Putative porin n=1 Tax=Roseateles saccharophilus TaxID=304 RepID=A0A4R3UMC6_ROSSA|nr:porin [Roseateles saccharophilus]MDG0833841.1 porin [Roseateles saccharophilus]TCU91533.1 putative porin [Roseateles saccharophilus]
MKQTLISAAVLAAFAAATPARADELADLKAEIAAQKQAAAAQQARLDALEKKLAGVQQATEQQAAAAKQAAAAPQANPANGYAYGQGLTVNAGGAQLNLYGLIDVSYVHANHLAAGAATTGPRVAWFSGNRWGMTGKRPMGDSGLDMIFRLEAEYTSQNGEFDDNTQMFGRDSWVGVQSDALGKLTLGYQDAPSRDAIGSAIYGDAYGSATPSLEEGGYSNNNNFKHLIFYAGSATGTRMTNSVVWKKDFKNGLFASAAYQFNGAGSAGGFGNNTTKQATLAYAGGAYNLAGFVTSASIAGNTHNSYSFGGNYTVGPLRLNAGYYHYTAQQNAALGDRKDDAYTLSGKYTLTKNVDFELGYETEKSKNAAFGKDGAVMGPIRAFNDGSAATTAVNGTRSTLYASVFYHFDKFTEVYLAGDYMKLKDGSSLKVDGSQNQTELAVGMRTRF